MQNLNSRIVSIYYIVSKLVYSLRSDATEPGLGYSVAEIGWIQSAAVFMWDLFVIRGCKELTKKSLGLCHQEYCQLAKSRTHCASLRELVVKFEGLWTWEKKSCSCNTLW